METVITRDCTATAIPAGNVVTLEKGIEVYITQTLGGNVTVRTDAGLFRIANSDVDALEQVDLVGENETMPSTNGATLEELIWEALKGCFDPEIPINIVDLGLVYDMRIEPSEEGLSNVFIKMTLTAQGCGMGPVIADDACTRVKSLDEVSEATVDIVWDPVWNPQMISEEGRKIMGIT